jgi:acetate---CoA ligase (ADP-forming)
VGPDLYHAMFAPSAVALVGASDVPGKATARPLEFLRRHGWAGDVYPINVKRETVLGERAWRRLEELPVVPDHALVLTPADAAVDAVRQCARLGVTVATVVADGFVPGTADGDRRRRQLREILDGSTLRLLGPSSLGVATIATGLALTGNAAFAEDPLPAGDVFVASQSGSVLGALLSRGVEMGVGFAGMVSVGNELDISLGEVCRAAVDDDTVAGFALFLENLAHADELADFARAAADRGKPVVAYKLGRSDDGARLSVSHTGALAGDDAVAEAFLRAHGIARVSTFDALLEAQLLARRMPISPSSTHRVAVVSTTGGGGAMAVDCLAAAGVNVTAPAPTTARRLADLGVEAGHGALIDLTLSGTTYETIKGALDVLLAAPEFDAVIAVPGSSARFNPEVSVKPIVDSATAGTADTALGVFVVPSAPEALRLLRRSGVPAFRTAESLADAMTAVLSREPVRPAVAASPVIGTDAVTLDEDASYAVLERLGLRAAPRAVLDVDRVPAQLPVPGPVVVKVLSASLPHKSDVGGVVLGVGDAQELRAAVEGIRCAVSAAVPGLTVDRLLVQQMVRGVAEVLIGFRRDPDVGPVVVLAAGGVLAEVYRDRSVRTAPVDLDQAHAMIGEVRGLALASGFRGAPRGDLGALAEAIVRMSSLAMAVQPTVIEAEVNPILVLADGDGVVAVDAVVSVARSGS